MKKILLFLLSFIGALCLLTACGGNEQSGGTPENSGNECTHSGGTATCFTLAVCETCGKSYGKLNPENHELTGAWIAEDGYHYRNCKGGCDVSGLKEKCEFNATCASAGSCEVCGVLGEELNPDSHDISTEWTTEYGYHFHVCKNGCDAQFDKESCESEGTCTEPKPCTVCGVDYVKKENHNISSEWTVENGMHFHTCKNGCGFKLDVGKCDITPTCTSAGVCSTCQTVGTEINPDAHAPADEWTTDGISHYKVCNNCCGTKLELGECDITPTCKDGGECSTCGAKGAAADPSKHNFATEFTATDTVHYKACLNGCGAKTEEGTHKYEWVNTTASTTTERGKIENICKSCSHAIESQDSPAIIMPLKNGATGAVVIIHDDGNWNTVQILDSLYAKYGLVGDVAMQLNGGRVVNSGDRYDLSDDTIATDSIKKWNSLFATNRWKLDSHTMTHNYWGDPDAVVETDELIHYEVVKSQALLREYFPGQRVLTWCYPGFSAQKNIVGSKDDAAIFDKVYSENARDLIEQYYISGRSTINTVLDIFETESDYKSQFAGTAYAAESAWNFFPALGLGDSNVETAKSNITKAATSGGISIMFMHNVVDVMPENKSNKMLTSSMDAIASHLSGYVKDGTVWNTHYEDAILYLREAQTAELTTRLDGDIIYLNLTDGVSKFILDEDGNETDEQIYTYPLTVRVDVPEGWKAIKYVQNGKVGYAAAKLIDGKWVADAEIVPDGGEAVITEAQLSDVSAPEEQKPVIGTEDINYANTAGGTISKAESTYNQSTVSKNFDTGSSISAKRADVQFDICISSAKVGANGAAAPDDKTSARLFLIKFGPEWSSTPYMAEIYATGNGGYYFSDIISTAGGTRNTSFSGYRCEYGKTYTVSITIDNIATESFKVTWKITDENGNTETIGTSTNFANESKALTTSTQSTVSCLGFTAQKRSVLEATVKNISIKAYK